MINKVTLLGRIGKKVYKPTRNGSNICTLSLVTNRKYIDSKGQPTEITTWHIVNFFNKIAEIVEKYANVGDLIYIEGEISNKKIEEDGKNRIIHSIIGNEVKFLPNMKKDSVIKPEESHGQEIPLHMDDQEIPF
jgi:single-strand DNA-binding protein